MTLLSSSVNNALDGSDMSGATVKGALKNLLAIYQELNELYPNCENACFMSQMSQ